MDIWSRIAPYVESAEEEEKVEFKQTLCLDTKPARAEFAKDVSAIANTRGGDGFLVIGVVDASHRKEGRGAPGFTSPDPDKLRMAIAETLSTFCEPPPRTDYRQMADPSTGTPLAVVFIPQSFARPHVIRRSGEGIARDQVWVRRGPACALAGRQELDEMYCGQKRYVVVNLLHPLDEGQLEQLRWALNGTIGEVINRPSPKFNLSRPLVEQVRELVDSLPLTSAAWEKTPIVLNPPGFAPATAVLLAELHGRMGYFPPIARFKPASSSPAAFELAEVIDLREVREGGRNCR
jgi:hypothetical protein